MRDLTKKNSYIKLFQEKLEKAKVLVFSNCSGVTVEDINVMRREVRKTGSESRVVKNTLLQRALHNLKIDGLDGFLSGSTLVTFGYEDPVAPVKALFDFADKCKKFSFKGGYLQGKVLDTNQLKSLSTLPGRKELLGMVASVMQGPIRNLVSVTQGPIRKLVYALEAIREQKEKAAA
jgi:large subunit ribosomal protein L10